MTGIIILAAGSSSRLGQPKQNLVYQGETLLQRSVRSALATGCHPVVVMLGANADVIKPTIEKFPVYIIYNENWKDGMSSSIHLGINELQKKNAQISGVILMLCDQPFVDARLLNQLVQEKSQKSITACAYNSGIGPPVFFDAYYFPELLLLKGNEGAKNLILKHGDHVTTIPFPSGGIDVDTVEDFENLVSNSDNPGSPL
ncbi:nucleotidyltransferase family protein [Mucilaginibacter xinganensis]|uniref:MobA-like protein n=1 Tax=Mucilaginibacter xinganensis TaxID=1234841 RepID=A0A223NZK5_9SPHI|nr:nucleotidyltransferase family protein [Mucilaginibacter xinganensis]ASU35011.1 MobA-like protein [Mucilaginibacter xinganensis]